MFDRFSNVAMGFAHLEDMVERKLHVCGADLLY
jgi:hypothetical protein